MLSFLLRRCDTLSKSYIFSLSGGASFGQKVARVLLLAIFLPVSMNWLRLLGSSFRAFALRITVFHLFLTLFWVRFLKKGTMVPHFVPCVSMRSKSNPSSSGVHGVLLTSGDRYVVQRSLHCRAVLPGIFFATRSQSFVPMVSTQPSRTASSRGVNT